jgi:hypothetical protein
MRKVVPIGGRSKSQQIFENLILYGFLGFCVLFPIGFVVLIYLVNTGAIK